MNSGLSSEPFLIAYENTRQYRSEFLTISGDETSTLKPGDPSCAHPGSDNGQVSGECGTHLDIDPASRKRWVHKHS